MVGLQRKKSPVGLDAKWDIDWDDPVNNQAVNLIKNGMSAQTISKETGLSVAAVYYRAKICCLKLRDYRNGIGKPAQDVLKKYRIRKVS